MQTHLTRCLLHCHVRDTHIHTRPALMHVCLHDCVSIPLPPPPQPSSPSPPPPCDESLFYRMHCTQHTLLCWFLCCGLKKGCSDDSPPGRVGCSLWKTNARVSAPFVRLPMLSVLAVLECKHNTMSAVCLAGVCTHRSPVI